MKRQLLTSLIGVLLASIAWAGEGNRDNPGVIPPQAHYGGMTYGEWSAEWWKWAFSIPTSASPFFDEHGDCTNGANGQEGQVWFLAGVFNATGTAERTCIVPTGRAIFFPIINTECSTVEGGSFALDVNNPQACLGKFYGNGDGGDPSRFPRTIANLSVTIDNQSLSHLEEYRVQSPVFEFDLPADNILDPTVDCSLVTCQAASDGFWVMLPPLSKGVHTIHFTGDSVKPNGTIAFGVNITYTLVVMGGRMVP